MVNSWANMMNKKSKTMVQFVVKQMEEIVLYLYIKLRLQTSTTLADYTKLNLAYSLKQTNLENQLLAEVKFVLGY